MNRIHRLVWSHATNSWKVVHEKSRSGGKAGSVVRAGRAAALLSALVGAIPALANPSGAQVVAGQVSMQQIGSTLNITNSPNAIINWQSFNIDKGELTRFIQQSAQSTVLNRVTGGDPSKILGALQSNGRVLLVNPNGVLFGKDARVDVAGLLVSTLQIKDSDFLSGKYAFGDTPGAGKIENQGSISTASGGQVILIAPQIENSGIIRSPEGQILLAAGKSVTIADPDHPSIQVEVTNREQTAVNLGTLIGKEVSIYGGLVKNAGVIQATTAQVGANGKIRLRARYDVENTGTLQANGAQGGDILIQAVEGTAKVQGTVEAIGQLPAVDPSEKSKLIATAPETGKGGRIEILAPNIAVDATVDASGDLGGGAVLIGGEYQGGQNPVPTDWSDNYALKRASQSLETVFATSPSLTVDTSSPLDPAQQTGGSSGDSQPFLPTRSLPTARTTTITSNARIRANGLDEGDGGVIVAWADDSAQIAGALSAQGGWLGGNGGLIETSAHTIDLNGITVNALAPQGRTGKWLIDPVDFTIAATGGNITGAQLSSNLNTADVEILSSAGSTGTSGDINVNDAVSWSSHQLTLTAANNININAVMSATGTSSLVMNTSTANGNDASVSGGTVRVGYGASGYGRIDFDRSGSGFLSINGIGYTVINALGVAGDSSGLTLQGINGNLSGAYALGANISAFGSGAWNGGLGFSPIGLGSAFSGSFNGLGHTINYLGINRPTTDFVGLFSQTSSVELSNTFFTNASIVGGNYVGILTGKALNASIHDVMVAGTVIGAGTVGGMVGLATADAGNRIDIFKTTSDANVSANVGGDYVGGLIGQLGTWNITSIQTITDSASTGIVTGDYGVGGLLGRWLSPDQPSTNYIKRSYHAFGTVTGTQAVGGLVGDSEGAYSSSWYGGAIQSSSNSAPVVGALVQGQTYGYGQIGGLVGYNEGPISASYSTGTVTSSGDYVYDIGGLLGFHNSNYAITSSSSTGNVTVGFQAQDIGGLIGFATGSIFGSYATGAVTAGNNSIYVGGLVGENGASLAFSYSRGGVSVGSGAWGVGGLVGDHYAGNVNNSYATGDVSVGSGSNRIGGLLGELGTTTYTGVVSGSYATGNVSAGSAGQYIGGFIGYAYKGTINTSYSTGAVTSAAGGDPFIGYIGATTRFNNYYAVDTATVNGVMVVNDQKYIGYGSMSLRQVNDWKANGYILPAIGNYFTQDADGYYLISSPSDLLNLLPYSIGTYNNIIKFRMSADIDLAGMPGFYVPYFDYAEFDGANHVISNLNLNLPDRDGVGLFGSANYASSIRNLGMVNVNIVGGWDVGGVLGYNYGSSLVIDNVSVTGSVSGVGDIGGLLGFNRGGEIKNSHAAVTVIAGDSAQDVGGLVGCNDYGKISSSFATGNVTAGANSSGVGGLVGYSGDEITFSYATGNVTSGLNSWGVGGLAGYSDWVIADSHASGVVTVGNLSGDAGGLVGGSTSNIDRSYAVGNVLIGDSGQYVGGLAGSMQSGSITESYASGAVSGGLSSQKIGGLVGSSENSSITDSHAVGSVTAGDGSSLLGGLIGYLLNGDVARTYASGAVTTGANSNQIGGLVGKANIATLNDTVTISDSFATGAVTVGASSSDVGGLLGYNGGTVSTSYSSGHISGAAFNIGGLVGNPFYGTVINSYWDFNASGISGSPGGGTPLTTSQMKQQVSFVGFDFASVWQISEGNSYPTLIPVLPINTWQGGADNLWTTAANWSLGYIPLGNQRVVIPDVSNTSFINFSGTYTVKSITSDEVFSLTGTGSHLTLTGNGTFNNTLNLASGTQLTANGVLALATAPEIVPGGKVNLGPNASYQVAGATYNIVRDLAGLQAISSYGNSVIASDIDAALTGTNDWNGGWGFTPLTLNGHLEGLGHTISNLTVNRQDSSFVGLVGVLGNSASISNLGLVGGAIAGGDYVGSLVGWNNYGTISNSYATGSVSGGAGSIYIGGLVGLNYGTISNSYATGAVIAGDDSGNVGGLVGFNGGTISNSYATGSVNAGANSYSVSGLVGTNGGAISNSYATGSVNAGANSYSVSGLVGYNEGAISNSYATGSVSAGDNSSQIGGLAGSNGYVISNSYATGSVSAGDNSSLIGGLAGSNGYVISNSYATGSVNAGANSYSVSGLVGYNGGTVTSSHYNIDTSLINGKPWVGEFGLYSEQLQDWVNGGFVMPGISQYFSQDNLGYWQIGSLAALKNILPFVGDTGNKFKLTASFSLASAPNFYIPEFYGAEFNGGGKTLSDISIDYPLSNIGFIGYLGDGSVIRDLTLSNINVRGPDYVGGLLGYTDIGSVINSHVVSGTVQSVQWSRRGTGGLIGGSYGLVVDSSSAATVTGLGAVGGLVGENGGIILRSSSSGLVNGSGWYTGGLVGEHLGIILDSHSSATVNGYGETGGLVGENWFGSIVNSYSTGAVTGGEWGTGGLVGYNYGSVSNSYSTGAVTGPDAVGGLVGSNDGGIQTSFSNGAVSITTSNTNVGGLVGENYGTVAASFWNKETSGQLLSAGGVGLTTAAMNDAANYSGWDFSENWQANASATPTLKPQTVNLWLGAAGDQNFNNSANWALGHVPTTGESAVIPYAPFDWNLGVNLNDSVSLTRIASMQSLTVASDLTVTLADRIDVLDWWSSALSLGDRTVVATNGLNLMGDDSVSQGLNLGYGARIDLSGGDTAGFVLRGNGYQVIRNVSQLQDMQNNLSGGYVLGGDIDASATSTWNSDGNGGYFGFAPVQQFSGYLSGLGHAVNNLYINRPAETEVGLIGWNTSGFIGNIGLVGGSVTGGEFNVGALVGLNDATVFNSFAMTDVRGTSEVGGLVGFNNFNAQIVGSYATGSVTADWSAGGLVGTNRGLIDLSFATGNVQEATHSAGGFGGLASYNSGGTITRSYATGNVSSTSSYVGGLVGGNSSGTIRDAYSAGNVVGSDAVGGLVGSTYGGVIDASFSLGSVTGNTNTGMLVGYAWGPWNQNVPMALSNLFWNTDATGGGTPVGAGNYTLSNVAGKTLAELKQVATYSGIDTSAWVVTEGQLPQLIGMPTVYVPPVVVGPSTCMICVWDGGGTSNYAWSLAANWANDLLPATGAAVTIGSGYGTIAYDLSSLTLASISAGSAFSIQSGKTLTLTEASNFNGGLNLAQGAVLTGNSTLSISGTTTDLSGKVVANGGLTVNLTGNLTNTAGGGTQIDASSGSTVSITAANIGAAGANRIGILPGSGTVSLSSSGNLYLEQVAGDLNLSNYLITSSGLGKTVDLVAGAGSVNIDASLDASVANDALRLTAKGATSDVAISSAVTAGSFYVQADRAVVLSGAAHLTASDVSGSSIVFNTGTGGFANNSDSSTPFSVTSGARWLVYALSPSAVTKGGLTSDFRHYGAAYANYGSPTEAGNGFIYASTAGTLSVTANGSNSSIYGEAVGPFAVNLTGFADTEDTATTIGLGGAAVWNAPSNLSNAGSYNVSYLSGLTNTSGYSFAAGSVLAYTVTPRSITVTADALSKTYGDVNPTLSYQVGGMGLANGDSLSGALATTAATMSNVGTYAIDQGSLSNANNSNYSITGFTGSNLTINPATLTLSAVTNTRQYLEVGQVAQATSSGTVQISGLKGTDSVSGLTQVFDSPLVGSRTLSVVNGYTVNDNNGGQNYQVVTQTATGSITADPANFRWVNANGGDWSTVANWNQGVAPVASASVTIPALAGPIVFSSGTSSIGTLNSATSLSVTGGAFAMGDAVFAAGNSLSVSSGTLTLNGVLTVPQLSVASGANLSVGSSGTLDLNAVGYSGSGALSNEGLLSATNLSFAGTFTNQATGVANLTSMSFANGLTNYGTINVTTGLTAQGAAVTQAGGTINLLNSATLTKDTGSLNWAGGTFGGNGTLAFSNGGSFAFSGNGNRVIDNPNLTFSFTDLTLPDGSLTLNQGGLQLAGTTLIPSGVALNVSGGTLTNNGQLNVGGDFTLNSGVFNGSGGISLLSTGNMSIPVGSTIDWQSTGPLANTGTLTLGGGTFTNAIDNQGTIQLGAGAIFAQPFSNSGTLQLNAGVTQFQGGYSQTTGTLKFAGGGILGDVSIGGGTLAGSGTLTGNLSIGNSATFAPGYSPGSLTVNGNLTLNPNSVLNIDLGGTTPGTLYDVITVSGLTTLNGTMNVLSWNGFVPAAGNTFNILNFGSTTGSFSTVSFPSGWSMNQNLQPTFLQLVMLGATGSGTNPTTSTIPALVTYPVLDQAFAVSGITSATAPVSVDQVQTLIELAAGNPTVSQQLTTVLSSGSLPAPLVQAIQTQAYLYAVTGSFATQDSSQPTSNLIVQAQEEIMSSLESSVLMKALNPDLQMAKVVNQEIGVCR